MTVFVFPTLVNPAALNEQELREELAKANHQILTLCEERNTYQSASIELARYLARITVAHLNNGDVEAVIREVIEKTVIAMPQSGKGEVH